MIRRKWIILEHVEPSWMFVNGVVEYETFQTHLRAVIISEYEESFDRIATQMSSGPTKLYMIRHALYMRQAIAVPLALANLI